MSKESYARGFCKAAAAAGVDPVALAKYAQDLPRWQSARTRMPGAIKPKPQYPTKGYVPSSVKVDSTTGIPKFNTFWDEWETAEPQTARDFDVSSDYYPGHNERLKSVLDPRHKYFAQANTNAIAKIYKLLDSASYPDSKTIPNEMREKLKKLYDDEMYRATNGGVRVSK